MSEETPAEAVSVAASPALPGLELPEARNGKPAIGMKTKLTGAGTRITRPHNYGDPIVLVLECRLRAEGHEETADGMVYVETLHVKDLFDVAGEPGLKLLTAVRHAYRVDDDDRAGRVPLPDDAEAWGITDANGVALTPEELAELRGDPVRAMLSDETLPVVVIYSDGARELWPDDFGKDEPRPQTGERFEAPGGDETYVAALLHPTTGETLAEWTEAQEDSRLEGLEAHHEAEEAKEARGPQVSDVEPGSEFDGPEIVDLEPLDPSEAPLPGEDEAGFEPLDPDTAADLKKGLAKASAGSGEVVDLPLLVPDSHHFAWVDRTRAEIVDGSEKLDDKGKHSGEFVPLAEVGIGPGSDADFIRHVIRAEEVGRGRGLKPRKSVLDLLGKRLAEVEAIEAKESD